MKSTAVIPQHEVRELLIEHLRQRFGAALGTIELLVHPDRKPGEQVEVHL